MFPDAPKPSAASIGHTVTVKLLAHAASTATTTNVVGTTSLTAKQVKAVQLLASGTSKRATAETLKVERHTLTRWGQLPAFRLLLARVSADLQASIQADTVQAIAVVRQTALDTLLDLMDATQPPQVRLQAVRTALEIQAPPDAEESGASFDEVMRHLTEGTDHAHPAQHPAVHHAAPSFLSPQLQD
jgi:hypothetical protein